VAVDGMGNGGLRALASRDFRLLFIGQLVSLTGSQMQQVAVAWQLYLLTHSSLSLGLLGLARVVPVILFALGGGVIADAVDRRRLMLLSQSLMASSSLMLAIVSALGRASPGAIYVAVGIAGLALALDAPARQALIPLLVPREHLAGALSLHAMAWQIASIVGPALGGVVLAWSGVVPVYVIDVASFGAVLLALARMRHRAPHRGPSAISLAAALDGLRFLRRTPVIWTTMVLDFVVTFLAGSLLLMPIFADQLLGVGARGLGLLYAAQPVGAALAAALTAVRGAPSRPGAVVLWAAAVYGAAIAAFGLSRSLGLSMLLLAVSGAADTVSMVVRQTLRQLATPDELRGRMTSVNMIFFIGGPQLGEVEAGVVARWAGPRFSVSSGGLACVVVALATALFVPSLRRAGYGNDSGARS
jgi:MFS family permease